MSLSITAKLCLLTRATFTPKGVAHQLRALAAFAVIWVQFPASTWQLETTLAPVLRHPAPSSDLWALHSSDTRKKKIYTLIFLKN